MKTVYLSGQVGRGAVSNENPPTSTLVGIDRLVNDRIQIEVDAVAVVEDAGRGERLTTTFLDPAGSFTQVATVQGDGAKTIYVSGQVGRPGEPRETQAQQALAGMRRRLALAGATPADLVKVTYYLPGYTPGNTGISGAREANEFPAENPPAATLLGIQKGVSPCGGTSSPSRSSRCWPAGQRRRRSLCSSELLRRRPGWTS